MGFNPGSTLGATDLRISVVAVNTNLAAVAGSAAAMLLWYFMFGKPDITMACNGMLAGWSRSPPHALSSVRPQRSSSALSLDSSYAAALFSTIAFLKSMIPAAQFPSMDTAAGSARVCVGIFADGAYGAGWNGVGATSYLGHAGQGVTDCSTATRASSSPAYGSDFVCGRGHSAQLTGFSGASIK